MKHLLTTKQAIRIVKKAQRVKFLLNIRLNANTDKGTYFEDQCASYVEISKKDALRIVSNMLSEIIEERGGRITILETTSLGCIQYWIGQ